MIISGIFLIMGLSSCSNKMAFQTSNIVPAARSYAKVKKDNNNNYNINVNVTNLAEPKRLNPPKDTYVVWIETANGISNVGRMGSSSSLFSNTLKAKLTAVSLTQPTRIFITAENDGNISFPGSEVVLSTTGN